MKKYFVEIFKIVVISAIILNIVSYYKSLDLNKEPFPLDSLSTIEGDMYIIKNKPTLIYFWATWCHICKFTSPNIQTLQNYFEVITVAVSSGEDQDIQTYLQKNHFSFKVHNDISNTLGKTLNLQAYPTILIYDHQKQLLFTDTGYTSTLMLTVKMIWATLNQEYAKIFR